MRLNQKNVFRSGYLVSWRWLTRSYLRKSICWAWWRAISARHVDGVTPAAASHGGSGRSSGKHQLAAEEDKIRRGPQREREGGSGTLVTYEMLREAAAFLFSKFSTAPSPLQKFKTIYCSRPETVPWGYLNRKVDTNSDTNWRSCGKTTTMV